MSADEGLQIFAEETRDLLRQMEQALLDLEGQPDRAEAINGLFRAAHTIKGSAGLFGFDRVVSFTHVLENVLDRVRGGQVALDADLAQLVLLCVDHMGDLLRAVVETDGDGGSAAEIDRAGVALLDRLGEHLDAPVAVAAPSEGLVWFDDVEPAAAAALDTREPWRVSLRFGRDAFRHGVEPVAIIEHMRTLGTLVRVTTVVDDVPPLAELDAESCHLKFDVLLRTGLDEAALSSAFEVVRDDCDVQLHAPASPLAEPAAAAATAVAAVAVAAAEPPAAAPPAATSPRAAEPRFLRVPADKLDRLITLVGELVIAGSASSTLARSRRDVALSEAATTVDELVEEIRENALRLRMVQVGETFNRFKRVVRDVSRELDKDISLVISGGETELDKTVVERMNDPLTHIVRNAIDHGIEDREARARAGKPLGGRLHLHAYHDSGSVVIEVSDDGRGLDRKRLLEKGRERGLVQPGETLTDDEILSLIFEPGFSTAAKVTNLSGRGVGMDVVRRNISELRGSVALSSVEGAGTKVTVRLPLTLAIIDGFLVKVGPASYVVPLDMVFECIELPAANRLRTVGGDYLNLRGEVMPLLRLRETFKVAGEAPARQSVVVLHHGSQRVGLVVDQLLGEHQTVIKPLGKMFAALPGVGGSTVLGTGEVALILDVPGLVRGAQARQDGGKRFGWASGMSSGSVDSNRKGPNDALVQ